MVTEGTEIKERWLMVRSDTYFDKVVFYCVGITPHGKNWFATGIISDDIALANSQEYFLKANKKK